jgi:hypothetical protein
VSEFCPRIDVMIAGAQKAGTSSLSSALSAMRCVSSHHTLEFTWFVDPGHKSLNAAYDDCFGTRPAADEVVVAKSVGIMFVRNAAERLRDHNERCKIVVILRHPVERAWSAYWYLRRVGREDASTFEQALELEGERLAADYDRYHMNAYRGRGDYTPQVRHMWEVFGEQQVKVVLLDDLINDPGAMLDDVSSWIGLRRPEGTMSSPTATHENASAAVRSQRLATILRRSDLGGPLRPLLPRRTRRWLKQRLRMPLIRANERAAVTPPMPAETRRDLLDWYAPRNKELARLLGRDLSKWSV